MSAAVRAPDDDALTVVRAAELADGDPPLRWLVRDPADPPGYPQMVIRLGYGAPGPPTPRRPLDEVRSPGLP